MEPGAFAEERSGAFCETVAQASSSGILRYQRSIRSRESNSSSALMSCCWSCAFVNPKTYETISRCRYSASCSRAALQGGSSSSTPPTDIPEAVGPDRNVKKWKRTFVHSHFYAHWNYSLAAPRVSRERLARESAQAPQIASAETAARASQR